MLWNSIFFLIAFILWTIAVKFIDVSPVGPDASSVGFATINSYFHNLVGVHWLSDIIGGALLSTGVVMMYKAFIGIKTE